MRYAVVDQPTETVIGTIVLEGNAIGNANSFLVESDEAQIGWTYDPNSGTFSPPTNQENT